MVPGTLRLARRTGRGVMSVLMSTLLRRRRGFGFFFSSFPPLVATDTAGRSFGGPTAARADDDDTQLWLLIETEELLLYCLPQPLGHVLFASKLQILGHARLPFFGLFHIRDFASECPRTTSWHPIIVVLIRIGIVGIVQPWPLQYAALVRADNRGCGGLRIRDRTKLGT